MKTVVQCDFDGTITEKDVSFMLLDRFAGKDWRRLFGEYQMGKIPVGVFNTIAFSMIKEDKQTLLDFISSNDGIKIRPGFPELLSYCLNKGMEFVIISNGLKFYIEAILGSEVLKRVKVIAAESRFSPEGMDVKFISPKGRAIQHNFKESYAKWFLGQGYRVIYIGNGVSDTYPARHAQYVFGTDDLLANCPRLKIDCIPFNDLNDVVKGMKQLPLNQS